MSDPKTPQEKWTSLGTSISSQVDEALQEARPAMSRMTHRVPDELQDLGESGKEAALQAKHRLEHEARHVRARAENFIQHRPFNAVWMAAGTGALVALAVSWLMRSRPH